MTPRSSTSRAGAGGPQGAAPEAPNNARKRKMMDKARVLFRKQGYHGTSMKDLAEAFGCKPANIYNYFANKEDLLFEVLCEEMEQIVLPVAHMEHDELPDVLEALRFFIINHARVTLGYRRTANMLFDTGVGHLAPARRKVIIDFRRQYDRILCRIIAQGQEAGLFHTRNAKVAAFGIASMVARSRVWYSPKGDLGPDDVGELIYELAVGGLRGGGAGDESSQ